jgi:hypothetical protein
VPVQMKQDGHRGGKDRALNDQLSHFAGLQSSV